jgi:hypothetical protein
MQWGAGNILNWEIVPNREPTNIYGRHEARFADLLACVAYLQGTGKLFPTAAGHTPIIFMDAMKHGLPTRWRVAIGGGLGICALEVGCKMPAGQIFSSPRAFCLAIFAVKVGLSLFGCELKPMPRPTLKGRIKNDEAKLNHSEMPRARFHSAVLCIASPIQAPQGVSKTRRY